MEPDGDTSRLLEFPVVDSGARRGSPDFEFAAAVAGFGMLLRGSDHVGSFKYSDAAELARGTTGRGADAEYRRELVDLVRLAERLD